MNNDFFIGLYPILGQALTVVEIASCTRDAVPHDPPAHTACESVLILSFNLVYL